MQPTTKTTVQEVTIRRARPEDAEVCGRICYDAFSGVNAAHNFPCDFASVEAATGLLTRIFSSPAFYAVVAEVDGRIVGSNVVTEDSIIAGIGPITVDTAVQNSRVGRKLMEAVMARANERGAAGARLVQAAFHNRSLSLYSSLGFDVREPLSCMQGPPMKQTFAGCTVRPAQTSDLESCNALARRVHGFHRGGELEHAIQNGTARVVERSGHVTGYTTHLGFFGHATADSNLDLQALIAGAESLAGPGILVPSRNSVLVRWCLAKNLRVVQPMTLMTIGLYNEPAGAWLASILY